MRKWLWSDARFSARSQERDCLHQRSCKAPPSHSRLRLAWRACVPLLSLGEDLTRVRPLSTPTGPNLPVCMCGLMDLRQDPPGMDEDYNRFILNPSSVPFANPSRVYSSGIQMWAMCIQMERWIIVIPEGRTKIRISEWILKRGKGDTKPNGRCNGTMSTALAPTVQALFIQARCSANTVPPQLCGYSL